MRATVIPVVIGALGTVSKGKKNKKLQKDGRTVN